MSRKLFPVSVLVLLFALGACSKKQTAEAPITTDPVMTETEPEPEVDVDENLGMQQEVQPEPVPILEDVFFDFDKFNLTGTARMALEKNATQLKDATSYTVTIEGHCDERGTNAYNMALGEKRANAAKDYLVSLGVMGTRISTVSYGEERPFAMGHDEEAWRQNRRGHFVVSKK